MRRLPAASCNTCWGLISLAIVAGTAGIQAAEPPAAATASSGSSSGSKVAFVMHRIGTFRYEACGIADFNNDGKLDVVSGPYIYFAPDWKPVKFRTMAGAVDNQGKGYYWDFMDEPMDVDGDGKLDVVSVAWTGEFRWWRNIGYSGAEWPVTLVEKKGPFECGDLWDIDGDGKANELLPHTPPTCWFELGKLADGSRGLVKHVISEKPFEFGGGVGDVNGDGRPDILRPDAWFEGPADPRSGKWIEHPWSLGGKNGKKEHTPQILVYDVNADGLPDIITSSAHGYGIFWYEQIRQGGQMRWKQHVIDDTWTQAHSLTLADLDGDGDLDLVTGKRFMAHNGGDPDEYGPLGVYWYELVRGPNPKWIKHTVSYNQGIGSGMSIPVVDLDGDGDLDIVVTGKWGGPVWFENKRK
jgi:hypothetical protein